MFLVLFVCLLLTVGCDAASTDLDFYGASGLEQALPKQTRDLMDGITLDAPELSSGVQEILSSAFADGGFLKNAIRSCALLLVTALLGGIVSQFGSTRVTTIVCVLASTAIASTGLQSLLGSGERMLHEASDFLNLLLPVLASATSVTGAVTAAGVLQTGTVFFFSLLLQLMQKLLAPLLYAMLAISTAEVAASQPMLGKLRDLLKWLVANTLKGVMLLYSAYMTISSVISGTADAAAVKAAKLAISGAVPVVGGMLADASETVLVSAGLVRNAVGTFGMLAVLAVCILPFLEIGAEYLLLKLTTALGALLAQPALTQHLETIATIMGLLLAMVGVACLMLLLGIVCFLRAGVG